MLAKVLFWLCAALAVGLGLNKTIDRMKVEAAIKSNNRKEADEKVEKLHSGDAAANALDQLCKQQG